MLFFYVLYFIFKLINAYGAFGISLGENVMVKRVCPHLYAPEIPVYQ